MPTDRIAYLLLRGRLSLLQEAGFEVTVICGDMGYGEKLRESGLKVLHIPFAREIDPRTDLRCAGSLWATLRRERFDIVHSHNPKGGLLGPVIARLARTPVVAHTVHGFLFNENSRGWHHILAHGAERWTALWCDHLLLSECRGLLLRAQASFETGRRTSPGWATVSIRTSSIPRVKRPAAMRPGKRWESSRTT